MDFYITKEEIVKSLSATLGVVEKRLTLPILSNVLISVDEASVKLRSTDLESEIETISSISRFLSGGQTTVPARKLFELCRLLPDTEEVHMFLDGYSFIIEAGSGKYSLETLQSADFPSLDIEEEKSQINIKSTHLKELLRRTSFAIAPVEAGRRALAGLYIAIDDVGITAVAADASRLAIAQHNTNESSTDPVSAIIPKKAVNEISRLATDINENIILEIGKASVGVKLSGTRFLTKTVDAIYPDYEAVIPYGEAFNLKINKQSLSEGLSRVSVISSEKDNDVFFKISNNTTSLSASKSQKSFGEEWF